MRSYANFCPLLQKCHLFFYRQVQIDRCQELLDSGEIVYIHGLGAAVSRALNVALAVKKNNCGSVDLDVRTATVNLVDDIDYTVRYFFLFLPIRSSFF